MVSQLIVDYLKTKRKEMNIRKDKPIKGSNFILLPLSIHTYTFTLHLFSWPSQSLVKRNKKNQISFLSFQNLDIKLNQINFHNSLCQKSSTAFTSFLLLQSFVKIVFEKNNQNSANLAPNFDNNLNSNPVFVEFKRCH